MMYAVGVKKSLIRKYLFFALLVVTPAGFLFKLYSGPVQWWFNGYGAGLLYEVFWILIGFLLWPKKALVTKIPLWAFISGIPGYWRRFAHISWEGR